MDFDFLQEFNHFTNLELLKIIKKPANYQPAAVIAAQQVLSTRNISQQELEEIENYLISVELEERRRKEKILAYKSKIADVFEPILIPDEEIKPSKWLKVLLIVLAIQYVRDLYYILPWLFRLLSDGGHYFEIIFLTNCGVVAYFPLIFILLLRRKRWGWILLFGETIVATVLIIGQMIPYLYYFDIPEWVKWDSLLWSITVRTAFLIFLLKKDITQYFHVDRLTIQRTFMIAVLLALSFMAAVHYFF